MTAFAQPKAHSLLVLVVILAAHDGRHAKAAAAHWQDGLARAVEGVCDSQQMIAGGSGVPWNWA